MEWGLFLSSLFEDGRLDVPAFAPLSPEDLADLPKQLEPYERVARLTFPDGVPSWDGTSGSWAAAMLLRGCQFAVYRDLDEAAIEHQLGGDEPEATPAAIYSVDLCFRYLPDVLSFAKTVSEEDPLVQRLLIWARHWPLSSVGVPDVEIDQPERLAGILSCPALRQTYVDRILATDDASRVSSGEICEAIAQTLGAHPELAPPRVRRALDAQTRLDDTVQ